MLGLEAHGTLVSVDEPGAVASSFAVFNFVSTSLNFLENNTKMLWNSPLSKAFSCGVHAAM